MLIKSSSVADAAAIAELDDAERFYATRRFRRRTGPWLAKPLFEKDA